MIRDFKLNLFFVICGGESSYQNHILVHLTVHAGMFSLFLFEVEINLTKHPME